jgi:hypothetical protein
MKRGRKLIRAGVLADSASVRKVASADNVRFGER